MDEYEAMEASKQVKLTRENRRAIIEAYERSGAADRPWSGQPEAPAEAGYGRIESPRVPRFETTDRNLAARLKARGFTLMGLERGLQGELIYLFAVRQEEDSRGVVHREPAHTAGLIEARKLPPSINRAQEEASIRIALADLDRAKLDFERSAMR